jgi:hypothetical protein
MSVNLVAEWNLVTVKLIDDALFRGSVGLICPHKSEGNARDLMLLGFGYTTARDGKQLVNGQCHWPSGHAAVRSLDLEVFGAGKNTVQILRE